MPGRDDILAKLAGRRVVASVSGGKDSAALSLHLRELGIEHDRVFMDTGWEKASTYDYLRGELTRVLGPITEIRGDRNMVDLIRHKHMFPRRIKRFCTEQLKLIPMQRYLAALQDQGADPVNAVGIRAAESEARRSMPEWEWVDRFDCETWRPLIAWSEDEVIAIHRRHGLAPNPLYLQGATRVGCWPCIHARKAEVRLVADLDPERIDQIRALEDEVSELHAKVVARRGEVLTHPRLTFFQGRDHRGGITPIDDVVSWSRTERGGKQLQLLDNDPDAGCMRWGLCDTAPEPGPHAPGEELAHAPDAAEPDQGPGRKAVDG